MFTPSFTRDACRADLQLGIFRCSVRALRALHWLPVAPVAPVVLMGRRSAVRLHRARVLRTRLEYARRLFLWCPARVIWAFGMAAYLAACDTKKYRDDGGHRDSVLDVFEFWFLRWLAVFLPSAFTVGGRWGC